MATFLHAVTLGTVFFIAAFTLLAAAAGLLWLADTLEHNPRGARTWGRALVYVVAVIHIFLYLIDGYPARQIILSLFALFVSLRVITLVPTPSLAAPNPSLVLMFILLPTNHISWWSWFIQKHVDDNRRNPAYGRAGRQQKAEDGKFDKIDQIVFYAVCVWLVPFFVFLSLSSTANPTPSPLSSTPPAPALLSLSLPPPSTSLLSSFLSPFLPRRYFQKPFDPTEGLLTTRPPLATNPTPSTTSSLSSGIASSPQPKWIGGGGGAGGAGGGGGGGESSASMRRVASGTHLVEEGHELPGTLGAELNGVGGGGGSSGRGGGGGSGNGRHWGALGSSMHPSSGRGHGERALPQRSATTGNLEPSGVANGDRKMS